MKPLPNSVGAVWRLRTPLLWRGGGEGQSARAPFQTEQNTQTRTAGHDIEDARVLEGNASEAAQRPKRLSKAQEAHGDGRSKETLGTPWNTTSALLKLLPQVPWSS